MEYLPDAVLILRTELLEYVLYEVSWWISTVRTYIAWDLLYIYLAVLPACRALAVAALALAACLPVLGCAVTNHVLKPFRHKFRPRVLAPQHLDQVHAHLFTAKPVTGGKRGTVVSYNSIIHCRSDPGPAIPVVNSGIGTFFGNARKSKKGNNNAPGWTNS